MILDGWGLAEVGPGNAIAKAKTPNFDRLWRDWPHSTLGASGLDVGLPDGQMGNSEVGHMNIGAGRIVWQELTLIDKGIDDGSFFRNPALTTAVDKARDRNATLHLLGLVSDGGVHSHINHLQALLRLAKERGCRKVAIHCITDGRDTDPQSGLGYLQQVEGFCREIGVGRIATVVGRYYAMDRDNRWERVSRAYQALVTGDAALATDPLAAVRDSYANGVTDEFIEPVVITDDSGKVRDRIDGGDSVIFFNFRGDRPRELTAALTEPHFDRFVRPVYHDTYFVTMTAYDLAMAHVHVAYPPHEIVNTFGQVIAARGLRQLRVAETEKYAHVTFFFNGGVEKPLPGEDRILVPSPKVATYDLQPQMSAEQVAAQIVAQIEKDQYDVIIINFANPDMVGHTGSISATVQAVQAVDRCLGQVAQAVLVRGGTLLLCADHGNAEYMLENGEPVTSHSTNRVPFICAGWAAQGKTLADGRLEDIAPTMLRLLGIEQPAEMTGTCLLGSEAGE